MNGWLTIALDRESFVLLFYLADISLLPSAVKRTHSRGWDKYLEVTLGTRCFISLFTVWLKDLQRTILLIFGSYLGMIPQFLKYVHSFPRWNSKRFEGE